MDQYKFSLVKL